jgi:type III restriction enzyme
VAGIKKFNERELILSVDTKNYDPVKYPLADWQHYLDILCSNREYQKEAIMTVIHYIVSTKYNTIEDLIQESYYHNDQLPLRYITLDEYFSKIQLPKKLSGCIELATGTGKSYVMYGIAQIALGLGVVDRALVLGPPSTTIEKELIRKFTYLSSNPTLKNSIPASSKFSNPSIINAGQTIKEGCICIENINAVYANTTSSVLDSLGFGKGSRCLILNDEVHHAYNKVNGNTSEGKSIKKWKEFLLDDSYNFKYIFGFTGTPYIENDYFNDIVYRYSLRSAIEDRFVKNINYVVEDDDGSENEKFQKILQNHKKNKKIYSNLKPLTILVTKDIRHAKQLKTRLVEFLAEHGEGTEEFVNTKKIIVVTSDRDHKQNVLKLPFVDDKTETVEWIISVAMLTEGWDVKNVFQIVPMEEKAFNSKLLIAQVLGRGLRIPDSYPLAEVIVFNHDKWSIKIKELVHEILEMETKIKNSPIINGERSKYHFNINNIDYTKDMKETEIIKNTETYNYKDYFYFAAESFEHKTDTKYVRFGDKEYTIQYQIEKEKYPITGKDGIIEKIYNEFQTRKLEGKILKLGEDEYTDVDLPGKETIEKLIRNSMEKVGLTGDYLGKKNRQVVFSAFNTLLRKKPKSVMLKRKPNSVIKISTKEREHETVSVLGLKSGNTVFFSNNWEKEIIIEDSLIAFKELLADGTLPRSSFEDSINPYLFKTPVDLVFTTLEPEKKFVKELFKEDNAKNITSWIKSKSQSFYSIEYSFTKGSHTSTHLFNPDFFILIKLADYEYISVIEIKSDNDNSDENKQKYIYAKEHFKVLNDTLKEEKINQTYFFNFLSPVNFSDYFSYLADGRLLKGLFISELDNLLENGYLS